LAARAKARSKARLSTYTDFVKKQLTGGAGALRAILRNTVFDVLQPVKRADGTFSFQVEDILRDENEQWKKVWLRYGDLPTPWRTTTP